MASPARLRPRRRYHFRSSFLVFVFVTLLVALGALNSQNNLLFWAFGFALALVIVSGLLSGVMLMGIEVTREAVADTFAGTTVTVRYRVRNRNLLTPAFALSIEEAPPRARSLLDRRPDCNWPVHFSPPRAFVAHVGPRQTVVCETQVGARVRGKATLSTIRVHTSFPFGLFRKSLEFRQPQTALVRPRMLGLRPSLLRPNDRPGESGSPSRRLGHGEEFFSLREYLPGDSPRAIAWRPSARRLAAGGQLLVRQNAAPAPLRVWVVLRLRLGAGGGKNGAGGAGDIDETAISLAASLLNMAYERSLDAGLAVPLAGAEFPPRHNRRHLDRLFNELALLELGPVDGRGGKQSFPAAPGSHTGGGSLCIVVHAGPIDRSFAPESARAVHLSAHDLESMIAQPGEPARPRRGAARGRREAVA